MKTIITKVKQLLFYLLFFMLFFTSCMKDENVIVDADTFPEEVRVFDYVSMVESQDFDNYVHHIDSADYTLTVDSEFISNYGVGAGDIIITDSGQGLLRYIEEINEVSPGEFNLITRQATLEEAIQEGYINERVTLTNQMINRIDYHYSGVKLDTVSEIARSLPKEAMAWNVNADFDVVELTGDFTFYSDIIFELDIRRFIRLRKVQFGFDSGVEANLEVVSSVTSGINEDLTIATVHFTPLTIPAGPIVIVVTPVLDISVYIDGNAEASIRTSYSQEISYEAGVLWERGDGWSTYSTLDNETGYSPPTASATANAEAGITGEIAMLLYNVLGAYADAGVYAELLVEPMANPWWELYAGYRIGLGARATVLWVDLFDISYPELLADKWLIAQASDDEEPAGTIKGRVVDAVTEQGLTDVSIEVYKNQNLVAGTLSLDDGNYSLNVPGGSDYHLQFVKDGYLTIDYYDLEVISNEEIYIETVMQIDESYAGNGTISGQVVDAYDGNGIPDATLKIREGINAYTGPAFEQVTSDGNGFYSFTNIPAGNYTLSAIKTGYNNAATTVISIGGQEQDNQNISMTPDTGEDVLQIVLDWGQHPWDLDAHLTGPIPGSDSRFHIFWSNQIFEFGGEIYAELDHDVVNSYGPETITIHHETEGVYRYSVHDFTNRNSDYSYALSNSSARVRVFREGELVNTFHVPSNTEGTLWTVFEMENGIISAVNEMSYESISGSIRNENDAELIKKKAARSKPY